MILNSIYEPDFHRQNSNFGFRPNLGTAQAIQRILEEGKSRTTAIEGDIKATYDTVDFDIIMNILSKKISDKKFLKIIRQGFSTGIFFKDVYHNTTLGIPPGGRASPILFHIYMHEFDKYVTEMLENKTNELNITQGRSKYNGSKEYAKTAKKMDNIKYRI